jgi:hypothetical protein
MKTSCPGLKKKLTAFYYLILKRQAPHTVVSWRFLVPGQSLAVKMHRAVFLQAWPQLPRWAWVLIFLYSHCLWVFFYSWKKTITAWRRYAGETQRRFHISTARQALDLLNLSLLHGIPPFSYYSYGLYRQPPPRWLSYVYTHELPHWHTAMSKLRQSSPAHRLLSDKKAFAAEMARLGIPAVQTIAFLPRGLPVAPERIFTGRSLYCKPNIGNQGRGGFELLYDPAAGGYRVAGEAAAAGESAVLGYLQRQVAQEDYLVQSLLVNHPTIQRLCGQSRLATVRLITGHDGRRAFPVGAVLEIPRADKPQRWWLLPVDCRIGVLLSPARQGLSSLDKEEDRPPELAGKELPCWQDALGHCRRAHEQLPAVAAIGWDVAITPAGAVLIEGNSNWGVALWQVVSGVPLLETELLRVYASRLWPGAAS